jgi:hypothetical protein
VKLDGNNRIVRAAHLEYGDIDGGLRSYDVTHYTTGDPSWLLMVRRQALGDWPTWRRKSLQSWDWSANPQLSAIWMRGVSVISMLCAMATRCFCTYRCTGNPKRLWNAREK